MSRPSRRAFRRASVVALVAALALVVACGGARAPGEGTLASEPVSAIVGAAEQAQASHDWDTAVARYREALARTPWNSRLETALAGALVERAAQARAEGGLRGLEQAERDLREASDLSDNAVLERNLAVVLAERAARSADPELAARLRAEVAELDPEAAARVPEGGPVLERRLDLAFEELERGQLDAGIERLEAIVRDSPDDAQATRLLAQALQRRGEQYSELGDLLAAAEQFDRAVELYAAPALCPKPPCSDEQARVAHRNRIVAWLNVPRPPQARLALEEAEAQGLAFPELRRALAGYE